MAKVDKKSQIERTSRSNEPVKKAPTISSSTRKSFARFFSNFLSTERYKATQGFTARTATAVALGVIFAAGLWRLSETLSAVSTPAWVSQPASRAGIPLILAFAASWFLYRLVNQSDFAEFLIATESEMNKVSWTTWADLKRATTVVLVTVVLMTTYLWVVDQVWSTLLLWIGVLRI
jgi:preprotein translocase subunit SecE